MYWKVGDEVLKDIVQQGETLPSDCLKRDEIELIRNKEYPKADEIIE